MDSVTEALPLLHRLAASHGACQIELTDADASRAANLLGWLQDLIPSIVAVSTKRAAMDKDMQRVMDEFLAVFSQPQGLGTRGNVLGKISQSWRDALIAARVHRIAIQWRARAAASCRRQQIANHSAELVNELDKVLDWTGYDAIKVAELSNGRPLACTTSALINKLRLAEKLNLNMDKVLSFLDAVEGAYQASNPYHSNTHAADVVQGVGSLLSMDDFSQKLTDLEVLALVIAAAVHDLGHPGVNNLFLVKSSSSPACVYNDISVNENGHVSKAFSILAQEPNNFLSAFPEADFRFVRGLVISLVLGTDMAFHTKDLQHFTAALSLLGPDISVWEQEHRAMLLKFILHASDISNPARPWPVAREWAWRITEENFKQGDKERAMGLPVSPMCDRNTATPLKGQHVFCDHFVRPMFEALRSIAPNGAAVALAHCDANSRVYQQLLDQGVTGIPEQ